MSTPQRRSQKLKQCQHCFKFEDDVPLKCCTNCRRAHYCSTECQKAEWKRHKPECQAIKQDLETMKQTPSEVGITVGDAEKVSKTWVQIFRPLLTLTALHALEIQRDRERVFTHVVCIKLSPTFTADDIPKRTSAIRSAFKFEDAFVLSIQDAFDDQPECKPTIEALHDRSREVRTQDPKAIGYPLVMLDILQCGLMRIIPLGIEEDPGLPWDSQWKAGLAASIARGISG